VRLRQRKTSGRLKRRTKVSDVAMPARSILPAAILLWLAGIALRITILAVPPVIPQLQSDLQMSGTEVGILSGLPTILIAVAALVGAFAISRFGALTTLVGGLIVTAAGTVLRGAAVNIALLFATTIIMSAGVAIAQPALPVIVRQWLPGRIGFGTATYTNGLVAGSIVPIALMLPLVMPLFDNSWRWALAIWALPVALVAGLLMLFAPPAVAPEAFDQPGQQPKWSSLDYNLLWRIGLIFGSNNSIFFGTNTFLPTYLASVGRPDLISEALTVYNVCQLPSSFLIMLVAHRVERRVWPFLAAGALALACVGAVISTASVWTVVAAGTLGLASGTTLALGLALPPLLSAPAEVGRVSAVMFMLSYTYAMLISVFGGLAWDLSGLAGAAFIVIAISILPLIILIPTIRFPRPASDVP
jgi:CP family cyanate transporter-like MFS transporter